MAYLSDHLAFALAPGAGLGEQVVVSASKVDPPCHPALSFALLAWHDVVRVVGSRTLAVRTGDLFLNHGVKLLAQVEVFEVEEQLDLEFGAFEGLEVVLVIDHGVVHFGPADSVVEELLVGIIEHFVG